MKSLDCLYSSHKLSSDNDLCEGCTILTQPKACHSVQDYDTLENSKVLFLSDSYRYRFGKVHSFTDKELEVIKKYFPYPFVASASVKCPSVKEADMSPNNMNICRQHLDATIQAVAPDLVFPCGNLAMKMLIKKSGITDKRGKSYEYTAGNGHSCVVVPLFHPYSVIKEPRHAFLFESDLINAYEKYILRKKSQGDFTYKVLMSVEEVEALEYELRTNPQTIAADIETTGLNFLTDSIQTIAISSKDFNLVIPLDHKDSPFKKGSPHYSLIWATLRKILENPQNKKIFHNAKFDLKFLISYGIYAQNIWDTKVMHHLIDENVPKSLMDLVKLYFPTELDSF